MKTLGSLLFLATLVAFYTGQVDTETSDGATFKGYELDCPPDMSIGCSRLDDPVCGMDGRKYSNECLMCNSTGGSNTKVCAKHKGECSRKGEKLSCDNLPVDGCTESNAHCGSDGVTYNNRCDYCKKQATDSNLRCLFLGHCFLGRDVCK